jgi:hypothetical protein
MMKWGLIPHWLRQLGDISRNPPRLIRAEQLGGQAPSRLILEIDIRQLLTDVVAHHTGGLLPGLLRHFLKL